MKRFSKLNKKVALLLTGVSMLLFVGVPLASADQSQQTSEGQIGGNNFYVKNETQNTAYGTSTNADACDVLRYKAYLYNPGPSFLSNVLVQASVPGGSATSNTATFTSTSVNAFPATTTATAIVNLSSAQSLSYVSGSTQLLDINNNVIENLPDGITQGGVSIGDLAASGTEFVQFEEKVSCPTTPTPPAPTPVYTCNSLAITSESNYTVQVSGFNTTATNGATFTNALINWGDSSTPLTTNNVVGQTHQYAQPGTYTITATANFSVNNQTVAASSSQCQQTVTFTAPPTTPTPPATTTTTPPTQLVNTGPGSVIGIFAGTSIVGAVAHRLFKVRRLSRSSI